MIIKPEHEAAERLKHAGVCPQCLGAGVFRSLIKKNGSNVAILVDCPRCTGKENKQ